jgi:hypothetical protein
VQYEPQQHQFACGVVDKDNQTAFVPAFFKPPMIRAIDLDQFAATITWFSRGKDARFPTGEVSPEPRIHHPSAQSLD